MDCACFGWTCHNASTTGSSAKSANQCAADIPAPDPQPPPPPPHPPIINQPPRQQPQRPADCATGLALSDSLGPRALLLGHPVHPAVHDDQPLGGRVRAWQPRQRRQRHGPAACAPAEISGREATRTDSFALPIACHAPRRPTPPPATPCHPEHYAP